MSVHVISISWSHTQCQTLYRDMSTLLLAIISLKHVTAYSRFLYTAPQIIILQLQFNYEKLTDFTFMRCLCERRSAKPALNRRLNQGLPQRGGMETNCLQVGPGGMSSPPPELVRSTHEQSIVSQIIYQPEVRCDA